MQNILLFCLWSPPQCLCGVTHLSFCVTADAPLGTFTLGTRDSSTPDLLNVFPLFPLPSQDLCQGSEEHAVPGQLPGPQHEVPAGEAHGECVTPLLSLFMRGTLGSLLPTFEQNLVVIKLPQCVCILQKLPAFPGRAPTHGGD